MKKSTTELQQTSDVRRPAIAATHLLGEGTKKALKILINTDCMNPMSAKHFAKLMWPDSKMHGKRSNQGNGACVGKAAWLAGGSFLSKLREKGFVARYFDDYKQGYYITTKGKEAATAFA